MHFVKRLPFVYQIAILILAYLITGEIGQMLAIPPGAVTAVWPPSGVALAFILLLGYRLWPGIWFGSFTLNLTGFFTFDEALPAIAVSFFIACGAVLEAVIGAYFLKKMTHGINPIKNPRSTFIFIIFSALVACIINATIGTFCMVLLGFLPQEDFWITWVTWWLGDSAGVITITPTLIIMVASSKQDFTPKKIIEVFILILLIDAMSFWLISQYNQLIFLMIPFVIWAVFRLGSLWSFLISLMISFVAITFIIEGYPLFGGDTAHQSSLNFQIFIAVVFIINLFLSSLLNERKKAFEALKRANNYLEAKVKQRTQALSQTLENLKRKEAQLLQAEKMSSLGIVTAGIAHEINNPINFIHSCLHSLNRDFQDITKVLKKYLGLIPENSLVVLKEIDILKEELQFNSLIDEIPQLIATIKNGSERIAAIVNDLRTFSRLDESERKLANVEEGLDATVRLLVGDQTSKIIIIREYGNIPLIDCFPGKLNQAFLAILLNAFDAVKDSTDPTITITTKQNDEDHVTISISDNGNGMTTNVQEHAFEPFFTTKDVGKGVGLGLTIAYGIIEEHTGKISIESEVGKGSKLIIILPIKLLSHLWVQSTK